MNRVANVLIFWVAAMTNIALMGPAPGHVRVLIIIDDYHQSDTSYVEAAVKLFSFMDKWLMNNSTRLIPITLRFKADIDGKGKLERLCKELGSSSNLGAIITAGTLDVLMSYFLAEFTATTRVPLIDLGEYQNLAAASNDVLISVRHHRYNTASAAAQELISTDFFNWSSVLIVYDRPEILGNYQQILDEKINYHHDDHHVPKQLIQVTNKDQKIYEIAAIVRKKWPNVLVIVESEIIVSKFLRFCLRLGILESPNSNIIITNENAHYLAMEDYAQGLRNVTFLRLINSKSPMTKRLMEQAEIFEKAQHDGSFSQGTKRIPKYRFLIPAIESANKDDDIPKMVLHDRVFPFTYSSALLIDSLVFLRHGLTRMLRNWPKTVVFQEFPGYSCRPPANHTVPVQNELLLKALLTPNGAVRNALTGHFEIDPLTRQRINYDLEVLGLGWNGLQKIGTWGHSKGLEINYSEVERLRFRDDRQLPHFTVIGPAEIKRLVKVVTILSEPFVMENEGGLIKYPARKSAAKVPHRYHGYCIDLLESIAQMLNFRYVIHVVEDNHYGSIDNSTGKWRGMIGELISGESDIAVAPLTITHARSRVVDFTKPFMSLGISILHVVPKRASDSPSVFSLLLPLAPEVWIFIIVAVPLFALLLKGVSALTQSFFNEDLPFNDCIWFTTTTLLRAGSAISLTSKPVRAIGLAWCFFSLLIVRLYTANLTAYLTVDQPQEHFQSADELEKFPEIKYGCLKSGSTQQFFRNSKLDTFQKMWTKIQTNADEVLMANNEEGIKKVLESNGSYAYLMESTSLEYTLQSRRFNSECRLRQVGGLLDSKGYGIATTKNSPLRDLISDAILRLQEQQSIQTLYTKWWLGSETSSEDSGWLCQQQSNENANVLQLRNVSGVFVILAAGLAIGIAVLCLELLWNCRSNKFKIPLRERFPILQVIIKQAPPVQNDFQTSNDIAEVRFR